MSALVSHNDVIFKALIFKGRIRFDSLKSPGGEEVRGGVPGPTPPLSLRSEGGGGAKLGLVRGAGPPGAEPALSGPAAAAVLHFQLLSEGGRGLGRARSRRSPEPPGAPAPAPPGGGLRPGPPPSPGQRPHARGPGWHSHGEGARPV